MHADSKHPRPQTHETSLLLAYSPAPALALILLAACSPDPPPTGEIERPAELSDTLPWFEEISVSSGVQFIYQTGHSGEYLMPEIKGGGAGLLDYNNDGLLDLFCVQGGSLDPARIERPTHKLFRNLGNWQFEDVTLSAGVGGDGRYGMGCACADFDGDGHVDIHVTHVQGSLLYRNNGNGTFTDVTAKAGLTNNHWGVGSAFFDLDGDSHMDLFMANYLRWTRDAEVDCFSRGGMIVPNNSTAGPSLSSRTRSTLTPISAMNR
jgi:hypothetical protein